MLSNFLPFIKEITNTLIFTCSFAQPHWDKEKYEKLFMNKEYCISFVALFTHKVDY